MNAKEEILQLRERTTYYRLALRELARIRCTLVRDALKTPAQQRDAALKLNEETMSVLQHASEISTTRLVALESEQLLIAVGATADCELRNACFAETSHPF